MPDNAAAAALPDGVDIEPGFRFYKQEATKFLEQGDLIPRSAKVINETLRKYHQYHVDKEENEFFSVLTQSCDLVAHDGACKARYIAFAPVRSLRSIIEREFSSFLLNTRGDMFTIGSTETRDRYDSFLHKLINNNDSRYFFLPAKPQSQIAEDMCIILPLSLAIRVDHYDDCISGRVAQLDDLFQAKLGWLLGQQYSRVGTPDWSDEALNGKIRAVSKRTMTWFPPDQFDQMKKKIKQFEEGSQADISEAELFQMHKACKTKIDSAIDAIFSVLVKRGLIPEGPDVIRHKLRGDLKALGDFNKHFKDQSL